MLSVKLLNLIETHAESLAREVVTDLVTNKHTPAFHPIAKSDLEPRIFKLYHNLGNWIADPDSNAIRAEYEDWGRTRCHQGIPADEIVYSLILTKKHLRRYIRDFGYVAFTGEWANSTELTPLELYGVQQLNYAVGDFFDQALYHISRGYEAEAKCELSRKEENERYHTARRSSQFKLRH
jgi:hypothetical protein